MKCFPVNHYSCEILLAYEFARCASNLNPSSDLYAGNALDWEELVLYKVFENGYILEVYTCKYEDRAFERHMRIDFESEESLIKHYGSHWLFDYLLKSTKLTLPNKAQLKHAKAFNFVEECFLDKQFQFI